MNYFLHYYSTHWLIFVDVRLALSEQRRKELYAKQGRGNQFRSKEERDRWIGKELKSLNKAIHDKEDQITRLKTDLDEDQEKAQKLELDIKVSLYMTGRGWPHVSHLCACLLYTSDAADE